MTETRPTQGPTRPATEWPGGLPEHVTRPLLSRITEQSMDEDYRQVALRRGSSTTTPMSPGRPHLVAGAVLAGFGVLIATAAVQTSANADITDASRATLIARAGNEREQVEAQQQRIVDLQDEVIALEDDLETITAEQQSSLARQRRLEVRTGFVPVRGEGVRITVDDTPDGDDTQLVQDEDLALLVDGLWGAGAEAIAVNNQRLTVLSGIRNVGKAIHINSRPVNPPYAVSAIGDMDTLAADLLDTRHGQQFFDIADQLGFVYSVQNEEVLELVSGRGPTLHHVRPGPVGKPGMDDEEAGP